MSLFENSRETAIWDKQTGEPQASLENQEEFSCRGKAGAGKGRLKRSFIGGKRES